MDDVKPASKTTKFHPTAANAFLLSVMLDRSVLAERAWEAGEWICEALGDPKNPRFLWENLANMEKKSLTGFLRYGYGGKPFHRYYKTFARLIPEAANHLLEKYDGDPRRIWNNQRNIKTVKTRLDAIPTIGPALANMAVLILARKYGLVGGKRSLRDLDVKPDVQVKRVFRRTGLVSQKATNDEVVEVARDLANDYPASLDAPAWEIGREYCRPKRPKCFDCPVSIGCRKIGV